MDALQAAAGSRLRLVGEVECHGERRGYYSPMVQTIKIVNIRRSGTGEPLFDFHWFTVGQIWMGLNPGQRVQFDARVSSKPAPDGALYRTNVGPVGETRLKLERPNGVTVISGAPATASAAHSFPLYQVRPR